MNFEPRETIEELSSDVLEDDEEAIELGDDDLEIVSSIREKAEAGLRVGACSEASPRHPDRNEDAYFFSSKRGVVAVFDGMGGVPAGDLAADASAKQLTNEAINSALETARTANEKRDARLIKEVFGESIETPLAKKEVESATRAMLERMNTAVEQLGKNKAVQEKAKEYFTAQLGKFDPKDERDKKLMEKVLLSVGCTASIVKMWRDEAGKDYATVGQVGDSRVYRLRNNILEKLTRDDSHIEILIEEGVKDTEGNTIKDDQDVTRMVKKQVIIALSEKRPELAPLAMKLIQSSEQAISLDDFRNMVTQAVGLKQFIKNEYQTEYTPQVKTYSANEGDLYLVVSDGVSDNLTDKEIQNILIKNEGQPSRTAEELQKASALTWIRGKEGNPRAKRDDVTALVMAFGK